MVEKKKVLAYITKDDKLLVLIYPFSPEAGVQVPAGTVEPDEATDDAVMREAWEETGLTDLRLVRFLGENKRDMSEYKDEIHHRFFYHLECLQDTPDTWRHYELSPSEGEEEKIAFDFYWVPLDDLPELIAGHGAMIEHLFTRQ